MPNFVAFDSKESPKSVFLKIKEDGDGECRVIAVNEQGDKISDLILFRKNGSISRFSSVVSNLGFHLDSDNRIVVP